jgi:hypothetical protein
VAARIARRRRSRCGRDPVALDRRRLRAGHGGRGAGAVQSARRADRSLAVRL